jgi:hypothetical protein
MDTHTRTRMVLRALRQTDPTYHAIPWAPMTAREISEYLNGKLTVAQVRTTLNRLNSMGAITARGVGERGAQAWALGDAEPNDPTLMADQ